MSLLSLLDSAELASISSDVVTEAEVRVTLRRMKAGKSPGLDGIP